MCSIRFSFARNPINGERVDPRRSVASPCETGRAAVASCRPMALPVLAIRGVIVARAATNVCDRHIRQLRAPCDRRTRCQRTQAIVRIHRYTCMRFCRDRTEKPWRDNSCNVALLLLLLLLLLPPPPPLLLSDVCGPPRAGLRSQILHTSCPVVSAFQTRTFGGFTTGCELRRAFSSPAAFELTPMASPSLYNAVIENWRRNVPH
jgi:hypothetical protein